MTFAVTGIVAQVKFVRTRINGEPIVYDGRDEANPKGPHTVFRRVYANNVQRATVFPDDYVLGGAGADYIGLDRYLAQYENVDNVTYEVLVGPGPFTISNLTEYAALVARTNSEGKTAYVTNIVTTGAANQTFTVHYSRIRDIAQVIAMADQLRSTAEISFTVPTDTPVTKFWLRVDGGTYPNGGVQIGSKTYTWDSGFLIPPSAQGVVTIRLADYIGQVLSAGEHTVEIALGNDRFAAPNPSGTAGWSKTATFKVNGDPAWNGQILIEAHNEHLASIGDWDWGKVVVAAYETPDLVNPVSLKSGVAGDGTITLQGLRKDQEYYLAAWYVKDAADGRDASLRIRQPYDTWGYLTALGNDANGFTPVAVPAQGLETGIEPVTNRIYLQDTDWNGNFKADRLEDFKAVDGFTPVGGGSIDYMDDFDLNGLPDAWEDYQEEEHEDTMGTSDDVMAYFEVDDMTYVALGKDDGATNWIWCAVLDARDPVTGYRLTDGTVKLQTPASEIENLYSVYSYYGTYDQMLTRDMRRWEGIGTNVTFDAESGLKVQAVRTGKAKFVHAQVYALFGYEPNACVPGSEHHTKVFTATDKYLVCRYLEAIGLAGVDERLMSTNTAYQWIWTLKDRVVDSDRDGIADGWELYTMFGPGGYALKTGVDGYTAASLTNSVAEKFISPFTTEDGLAPAPGAGSELELIEEYDNGHAPTDPWAVDTDRDGVADRYAYWYHLKGDDAGEDWDNDGLSNYAEYLISEVFKFAKCNPDDPRTSDGVVDAYKKVGELYLGELFSDHDQMEDDVEDLFPEMSRSLYDAHLDGDGDGWSNYAEVRSCVAAGVTNVEVVVTNGGKVAKQTVERPLYAGRPQPKIRLTLNYFGARLPAGKTAAAVVKVYGDGPEMMRNDAIYVVSNVVYGANRVVLEKPVSGSVREGANWFAAYLMVADSAASADGSSESAGVSLDQLAYAAGMPFGSVGGFWIGWAEPAVTIDVTDQSAIFDRIDLYAGESSRQFENGEPANDKEISHDRWVVDAPNVDWSRERVRIVPYAVRGTKQDYAQDLSLVEDDVDIVTNGLDELRVAADFYIDRNNHSMISEADVIDAVGQKFDLDWDGWVSGYFTSQRMSDAVGEVTLVKYRVILGEGSYLGPLSNLDTSYESQTARVFTFPIDRRFEVAVTRTKAVAVSPVGGGVVYSARPTFRWRLDEPPTVTRGYGSSYTAFQIVLFDANDKIVYDSGFQRAPAKDANGEFAWTAPICAGALTPKGVKFKNGTYRWQVQMYNAKFRNAVKAQWASGTFALAAGLQQEVNDGGYGRIDVAVRYTGPSEVLAKCGNLGVSAGKVIVEAYDTPDFTGDPLAATVATDAAAIADAFNATNTVSLVGLKMGGTYYVRAFIDSNGNGAKDDFESWGCVNRIGEEDAVGCYEPKPVALATSLVHAPVVGLFIDDADTDQDWLPDAWEYAEAGWTGDWKEVCERQKAAVGGTISIDTSVTDGTAGISSGLIGAPLTVFENGAFAKQMLGIDSVVSFADIRAAIDRNVRPTKVKISALKLEKDKVVLDLDADVALSLAGRLVSQVYGVMPSGTAKATVRVLKRTSLAAKDDWQEVFVKENVEIGPGRGSVEVPLGTDVDLTSGFYKVEVEQ